LIDDGIKYTRSNLVFTRILLPYTIWGKVIQDTYTSLSVI